MSLVNFVVVVSATRQTDKDTLKMTPCFINIFFDGKYLQKVYSPFLAIVLVSNR